MRDSTRRALKEGDKGFCTVWHGYRVSEVKKRFYRGHVVNSLPLKLLVATKKIAESRLV